MGNQLQTLKAKHREIARLAVCGRTPTEIAESPSVDMTVAGVRNVLQSPIFLELYAELTIEADKSCMAFKERMDLGKEMAVDRIIETLKPDAEVSKVLQSKNAFDLLNTTDLGHKMPSTLVAATINPDAKELISPKVMDIIEKVMAFKSTGNGSNGGEVIDAEEEVQETATEEEVNKEESQEDITSRESEREEAI